MKTCLLLFALFFATHLRAQVNFTGPFAACGVEGSITIYDYKAKKWTYSNETDSKFATLPASTFKILNTLISLETGAVTDENELIQWPGEPDRARYGYRPDIYHSMNLKEAFKVSAVWVYIELAKKVGKDQYRDFLSRCHYGNGEISIDDPDFWNFGNFAVTPVNQVETLIGVYEETLPFSTRSFKILKDIMVELGGEIRTKGRKNNGEMWRIGIESPSGITENWYPVKKVIMMETMSITTSGNYRRYFMNRGEKYGHVIDPRSGYPVDNGIISVTVIAPDAISADGWDNGFYVMGIDSSFALLKKYSGLELNIIYQDIHGIIRDTSTAGFKKLLLN